MFFFIQKGYSQSEGYLVIHAVCDVLNNIEEVGKSTVLLVTDTFQQTANITHFSLY